MIALVAGCVAEERRVDAVAAAPASADVKQARAPVDAVAQAEEARAVLAQAETDVQRARSKRVLWTKAWESLLDARKANEQQDPARAIQQARRASEFAQLGIGQAGYPAVR